MSEPGSHEMALLGLSDYEGRVYRAMLTDSPATAYRLGRISGVPLSRVYEIANRLVEKGAAVREPGEPAQYVPVAPSMLVESARRRAVRELEALDEELSALWSGQEAGEHLWIRGEDAVITRVAALAAGAEREILLTSDADSMHTLHRAMERRPSTVRVHVIETPPGPGFCAVFDRDAAIVGRLGLEADALITRHPAILALATDRFHLRGVEPAHTRPSWPVLTVAPDWLDFEEAKQRKLLHVRGGTRTTAH